MRITQGIRDTIVRTLTIKSRDALRITCKIVEKQLTCTAIQEVVLARLETIVPKCNLNNVRTNAVNALATIQQQIAATEDINASLILSKIQYASTSISDVYTSDLYSKARLCGFEMHLDRAISPVEGMNVGDLLGRTKTMTPDMLERLESIKRVSCVDSAKIPDIMRGDMDLAQVLDADALDELRTSLATIENIKSMQTAIETMRRVTLHELTTLKKLQEHPTVWPMVKNIPDVQQVIAERQKTEEVTAQRKEELKKRMELDAKIAREERKLKLAKLKKEGIKIQEVVKEMPEVNVGLLDAINRFGDTDEQETN